MIAWDADTVVRCVAGGPSLSSSTPAASSEPLAAHAQQWATPRFTRLPLPPRGSPGTGERGFDRSADLVHGGGLRLVGDSYDGDDVDEAFVAAVNAGSLAAGPAATAAFLRQHAGRSAAGAREAETLSAVVRRGTRPAPLLLAQAPLLTLDALEHAFEALEHAAFIRTMRLDIAEAAATVAASRVASRARVAAVLRAGLALLDDDSDAAAAVGRAPVTAAASGGSSPTHGARSRPSSASAAATAAEAPPPKRARGGGAAAPSSADATRDSATPRWQLPVSEAQALLLNTAAAPPLTSRPPPAPAPSPPPTAGVSSSEGRAARRRSGAGSSGGGGRALDPSDSAAAASASPSPLLALGGGSRSAPPPFTPLPLTPGAAEAVYHLWVARRALEQGGAPLLRCFQTLGPGDAPDVDSATLIAVIGGLGAAHGHDGRRSGAAPRVGRRQRGDAAAAAAAAAAAEDSDESSVGGAGDGSRPASDDDDDDEDDDDGDDGSSSSSSSSDDSRVGAAGGAAAPRPPSLVPALSALSPQREARAPLSSQGQLRDIDGNIRALARIRRLRLQLERGRILLDLTRRREKLKRDRAREVAAAVRSMCGGGGGAAPGSPQAAAAELATPPYVAPPAALFAPPPPVDVTVGPAWQAPAFGSAAAAAGGLYYPPPALYESERAVPGSSGSGGSGSGDAAPLYCTIADALRDTDAGRAAGPLAGGRSAAAHAPTRVPRFVEELRAAAAAEGDVGPAARPMRTAAATTAAFGAIRIRVPRAVWEAVRGRGRGARKS